VSCCNRWGWRKFDIEINSWHIGNGILQNIMYQIPFDIFCIVCCCCSIYDMLEKFWLCIR
jgi:hypothetical protein